MKEPNYELDDMRLADLEALGDLRERDLCALEDAIRILRNRAMVKELRALGVRCHSEIHRQRLDFDLYNSYIFVSVPGESLPVEATLFECQRLIDTIRNLPVDEALKRWVTKVAPVATVPYTEDDARRDTREARAQLQRDLEAGKVSPDMYADLYRTTSFMDLAER